MGFLNFLNGFRKLTICVLVLTIAVALTLSGYIDGSQLTSVLTITVPAYFAGNIGEHLVESVNNFIKSKFNKE